LIFTAGDDELDEAAKQARQVVESISGLSRDDADYVYAVVYAALTTEASIELQGIMLQFPACEDAGAIAQASRLISWETLLPFLNSDVTPAQAQMLADRLRGLADICETFAGER
jgi:hypothetical protein